MTIFIDPDCLACVKCYRVIATVGTGQWHYVDDGRGGVSCDECEHERGGREFRAYPGFRSDPMDLAPMRSKSTATCEKQDRDPDR